MAKDLTAALARLTDEASGTTSRMDKALPGGVPAPDIPARVGIGRPKISGSGSGIASPLTETAFANRTHWANISITSTDGLITIVMAPIKQMSFTDANNVPLIIDYKQPT